MRLRPVWVLLLLLPVLASCGLLGFQQWSWNQKLTVVVQTPNGEVSGSAVSAVSISFSPSWWGMGDSEGASSTSLVGEAAVVEVAPGKYIFAVLQGYSYQTAIQTFQPDAPVATKEEAARSFDALERLRLTVELPREIYPLLVTFDDVGDPASLKRVSVDDISKTFGAGYRLKSINLSITDEPVTKGVIEKVLPWLAGIGRERATIIPNPPSRRRYAVDADIQFLTPLEFSTELYK